jgi:hypothetical protein
MENAVTRRSVLALGAAAIASARFSGKASAAKPPVLVELFTSQGCSSCPPADKLAGVLAAREDVVVVSLNVDYWDYLGWKDTLARAEFTKRQMDYAHSRGDGDVYTPQMVINGATHVVGSNRKPVEDAIANAAAAVVPVTVSAKKNELTIDIGEGAAIEATLWLLAVRPSVEVVISRGENSGSTIAYHNVVRSLVPAGMWKGSAKQIVMPRKSIVAADCKSCIAVLQRDETGPLLGIGRWDGVE